MVETSARVFSAAHLHPELRDQNPLYAKAGSLTQTFEKERCPLTAAQREDLGKTEAERRTANIAREKRRASFMVKRSRPRPEPRPSRDIAAQSDRAAFGANWRAEGKEAFKSMRWSTERIDDAQMRDQAMARGERR
ncbi:MAG: hypothetical protein AAF668_06560 [Pseudomonadota bacterium]